MGYYTCKMLFCELKKDTPKDVVNTIRALVNHESMPSNSVLNKDDFLAFKYGLCGYTFSTFIPHNSMEYDDILGWKIFFNGETKHYEREFERCLEWLRPYISSGIGGGNMYAMTIGEGDDSPTLYKLSDKE